MRRTFQDLARAAEVKDIVTRAISGRATETMQHHYSSVGAAEEQTAIAKVIEPTRLGSPSQSGSVAPDSPRKSEWTPDTPIVWQRQIPAKCRDHHAPTVRSSDGASEPGGREE